MEEALGKVARLLVDVGVEYAFGVTGSGQSLRLITELESSGVKYLPTSHEAAAALMAGAVTKVTDRLAVAISIKGPGLASMVPGIAYNHFENNPVISVSEAAGDNTPVSRRHKRLDHASMISTLVKAVGDLDDVQSSFTAMLDTARAEIPGPVHLDLCVRKGGSAQAATVDVDDAEPGMLSDAFRRIEAAHRPAVIAGSLALRRSWRTQLARLRIPVFTTAAAKGALDETLEQAAGVVTGDGKGLSGEACVLPHADLVVGLGLRNTEVISPRYLGPTILLDEAGVDSLDQADGFHADLAAFGVTSDAITEALAGLMVKSWGCDEIALQRASLESELCGDWLPGTCFRVLNDLSYDYVAVMDTGLFCTVGEHQWRLGPRRPYVASSNGRFMGVSVPLAIGAALSSRRPVFCVVGAGGVRSYVAEMKLAVRERLPVCVLLMSDGRYGSVAAVPQPYPASDNAVAVPLPSWCDAMAGMGCDARRVSSPGELEVALARWTRRSPLFLEATFEPERYAASATQLS